MEKTITADFSKVAVGQSVHGMDVVAPGLNITAKRDAVKIVAGQPPSVYDGNAGLAPGGGFSDYLTHEAVEPHLYTFTFAQGATIKNFSLRILDFGDYNPTAANFHFASMTAYGPGDVVISQQQLSYTTTTGYNSERFGNLLITGDSTTSRQLGRPDGLEL